MPLFIITGLLTFLSIPAIAHAEPVTAAIFGTAFASIASAAVNVAISISVSRGYSLLRRK